MSSSIMLNHGATSKQLRSFGLLAGWESAVIGPWPLVFRREDPRTRALTVAILFVLPALVYPQRLRYLYREWRANGHVLAFINTRIIPGISSAFHSLRSGSSCACSAGIRCAVVRRRTPRPISWCVNRTPAVT